MSCLLYTPPACYDAPLSLQGTTLYTNEGTACESSVDLSSIIPAPYIPSLQEVCDVGNTTDTDIEITDKTMGIIMTSTDNTRHRITLVDDGLGNYNLDISATLP